MIAIHTKKGAFFAEWVAYCRENDIPFKIVDCFATDIIDQLQGCRALLWHWEHHDYQAALFARQLIASAEAMGLVTFPSTASSWHYDDKVGQKYLLEAIGAPLIPSHVFYDRDTALRWVENAPLPLVWKLRGGAGSQNVRLVRRRSEARRLIRRSFGKGWSNSRWYALQERLWQFRRDRTVRSFIDIGRGFIRGLIPHETNRNRLPEKNYVYFQDFIPENHFDIRVVVIGKRAFAIKRLVRSGDFRASGSGAIVYEEDQIPLGCVEKAFQISSRMQSQSCAFDFVRSQSAWLVVEISYAFSADAYRKCPGFWDDALNWHEKPVKPEQFMIEDVLAALRRKPVEHG